MNKVVQLYRYFSPPERLVALNAALVGTGLALNIYFQVYCLPTAWATCVLSVCFANTIFYPLLERTKLAPLTRFINGVSCFVFVYCILFLEIPVFAGLLLILLFGIGLLAYLPHFLALQLLWKTVVRPPVRSARYLFLLAVGLCLLVCSYFGREYKDAVTAIGRFEQSGYRRLERNFMTEKILGMHFIYHTRFCDFDGWRPPLHEPALIIGMWLNGRRDPLKVDLATRLRLYKRFFPRNRFKLGCSCGIEYRRDYHEDPLWH